MDIFETDKVCLLAPFSAVVLGRSGSGKTTLLRDLIKCWTLNTNAKRLYRFSLIHTQHQPLFDEMINYLPSETIVEIYEKPPSNLEHLYRISPDENSVSLIVFDDCQSYIENSKYGLFDFIMNVIRVKSHHNRVCIIVILQDTLRDSTAKLLSQANYLILTPNCGTGTLTSQIQRILFTGDKGLIRSACKQAFYADKSNCLLIDSHPLSDALLRFRSNAIRTDSNSLQTVYVPSDLN